MTPEQVRAKWASMWTSIEGPAYADRVGGKLTFRDWDKWTAEDQAAYRELRDERLAV